MIRNFGDRRAVHDMLGSFIGRIALFSGNAAPGDSTAISDMNPSLWLDPEFSTDDGGASEAEDLAGGGTWAQATEAARLQYTTINGVPAFQGASGDYIALTTTETQAFTCYIIAETPASAAANQFLLRGTTTRADIYIASNGLIGLFAGSTLVTSTAVPFSERILIRAVFSGASSKIYVWCNGASAAQGTGNAGSNSLQDAAIGGNAGASSFLGKMGPFICIPGDTSASDAAMVNYLLSHFNIVPA